MSDSMVPIAIIHSRSEAMVVASLLDANGIIVHIGGYNHAAVSLCQLGLGGFRLTVPAFQHRQASRIISDTPGFGVQTFSYPLQKAVIKVMIIWSVMFGLPFGFASAALPGSSPWTILWAPLSVLSTPANPQVYAEYFLSDADD